MENVYSVHRPKGVFLERNIPFFFVNTNEEGNE